MRRVLKMSENFLDKLRGCMVGGVVGDCLGSPVECMFWKGISLEKTLKKFSEYRDGASGSLNIKYTDDTAMARQIAFSLIDKQTIDPTDLANHFWKGFQEECWRGYGSNVKEVFRKLAESSSDPNADPFKPADEQFGGNGSYGNGAAMRVHPVGLFFSDLDEVVKHAEISAKITHSNVDGINGAVLQAVSTHLALKDTSTEDHIKILKNLAGNLKSSEKGLTYNDQLDVVIEMLESPNHDFKTGFELGNSVSAIESVPTAIYSYLKAQEPIEGLETDNPFERTIQLALTFGGDSDTICSMAGALAGARYGESAIPDYMKKISEGVDDAKSQADQFYKIISARSQKVE